MSLFLMRWLVFVVMNLAAGVTATTWTVRYLHSTGCPGWAGAAAAWLTLFVGSIVLVQTLLGIAGWLSPAALVFVTGAGAIASVMATRADLTRTNIRRLWPPTQVTSPEYWRAQGLLVTVFLAAWLCIAMALAALLEPSTHFDTYAYHLSMVADWMQARSLTAFYLPFAEIANSYFPGNGHLLLHWLMAPLGSDLLVRLASLAMWCVLGVSLYRVCRQLGASVRAAFAAAILMLFIPVVLSEATDLSQDLAAAALFMLALSHLLEFHRRPTWSTTALFAVAAGAFTGVKYSGLTYLALLVAGWLAVLVLRRSILRFRQALVWGLTLAIGACLLGGYWYIRNLWLAHNPMFPLRVALLGRVIFDGPVRGYDNQISNRLADISPRAGLEALVTSYDAYFGMILLSALAVLVIWLVRRRNALNFARIPRPGFMPPVILMAGLLVVSSAVYTTTPYSVMRFSTQTPITANILAAGARFSLVSLALCCVFIALALYVNERFAAAAILFVNLSIIQGLISGYDGTRYGFYGSRVFSPSRLAISAMCLGLCALAYGRPLRPLTALRRHRLLATVAALLLVVLLTGCALAALANYRSAWRYTLLRPAFGPVVDGWQWLDKHSDHARVAYTGGVLNYGLYGPTLKNQVRYVNVQGGLDERWHDFFLRGEDYRASASYRTWLAHLRAWGAQYLVVNLPSDKEEDRWARANPGTFKPVFANEGIRIYQVKFGS